MERLTEIKTHVTGFSYTDKKEGIFAQNVYAKLAAYEDTGLTPAQVEAMKMDMEQLRADNINAEMNLAHMTADKDEQAGRLIKCDTVLKQAKTAINNLMSCNEISKIADVRGEDVIKAIDALLGGKEDA